MCVIFQLIKNQIQKMKPFEELVPPEVAFNIFSFMSFRSLLLTIPKVCSSWRRIVIEKLDTLHIYPDVDIYDPCDTSTSDKTPSIMIRENIVPFVRYCIKFIQGNNMTIRNLLINGSMQHAMLKKCQSSNQTKNHLISNRDQEELKKLFGWDELLPNPYTEPSFKKGYLEQSAGYTQYGIHGDGCFMHLATIFDSDVFSNLLRIVGPSMKRLVLKDLVIDREFAHALSWNHSQLEHVVLERIEICGQGCDFVPINLSDVALKLVIAELSFEIGLVLGEVDTMVTTNTSGTSLAHLKGVRRISAFASYDLSNIGSDKLESLDMADVFGDAQKVQAVYRVLDSCKNLKRLTLTESRFGPPEGNVLVPDISANYSFPKLTEVRLYSHSCLLVGAERLLIHFPQLESFVCGVSTMKSLDVLENVLSRFRGLRHLTIYAKKGENQDVSMRLLGIIQKQVETLLDLEAITLYDLEYVDEQILSTIIDMLPQKLKLQISHHIPISSELRETILSKRDHVKLTTLQPAKCEQSKLPKVDYKKPIRDIIKERKDFTKKLQELLVSCPFCSMEVRRDEFEAHNKLHILPNDDSYTCKISKQMDLSNYECICISCRADVKRKDLEEHYKNCSKGNVLMMITTDTPIFPEENN